MTQINTINFPRSTAAGTDHKMFNTIIYTIINIVVIMNTYVQKNNLLLVARIYSMDYLN